MRSQHIDRKQGQFAARRKRFQSASTAVASARGIFSLSRAATRAKKSRGSAGRGTHHSRTRDCHCCPARSAGPGRATAAQDACRAAAVEEGLWLLEHRGEGESASVIDTGRFAGNSGTCGCAQAVSRLGPGTRRARPERAWRSSARKRLALPSSCGRSAPQAVAGAQSRCGATRVRQAGEAVPGRRQLAHEVPRAFMLCSRRRVWCCRRRVHHAPWRSRWDKADVWCSSAARDACPRCVELKQMHPKQNSRFPTFPIQCPMILQASLGGLQ